MHIYNLKHCCLIPTTAVSFSPPCSSIIPLRWFITYFQDCCYTDAPVYLFILRCLHFCVVLRCSLVAIVFNLSKTEVGFVLHRTPSHYLNYFKPITFNANYLKNVKFRKLYLGIIRSFCVVSKHQISSFCLEYGSFRELKI